ncbi:MAG: sugar phosphate isomerase/epimerase [Acidobacterium ailaaui]|nr:sugar phosphate isomerase/epimerase [Pseudacidobacterium ailaaui]
MKEYKNSYSCADFTFPLLPHDKALRLIKLMGFDAVDLGIFEDRSHHYPSKIVKNPKEEGKSLYNTLSQVGLVAADVFLQTGKDPKIASTNDPDKSIRKKNREIFLRILDFICEVGSTHITGLPGVYHEGHDSKDDWMIACEETNWRLEVSSSRALTYAIEPHLGSILPTPTTTLKFIADCPGLTLTLDYGHFIYQGFSNEAIHPLIPYASHFHARAAAKGVLQARVRDNRIDFKTIVSKLREVSYKGFICFEYVYDDWGDCDKTDNVSETLILLRLIESF